MSVHTLSVKQSPRYADDLDAAHSLLHELVSLPEIISKGDQVFLDGVMAAALQHIAEAKRKGAGRFEGDPDGKLLKTYARLIETSAARTSAPVACSIASVYAEADGDCAAFDSQAVLKAAAHALGGVH